MMAPQHGTASPLRAGPPALHSARVPLGPAPLVPTVPPVGPAGLPCPAAVGGPAARVAVLLALTAHLSCTCLHAQELSARQIVARIDSTERVAASDGQYRQVITTSGGRTRTLEMRAYSRDRNDKQLLIYTGPRRVKGDKILMLNEGDDIWFYTPKTDRVRHLASHARRRKVQGSDFAYEDMAGGSIEEDYTYALVGREEVDGVSCHKFELIPTESGPYYERLLLWADAAKYVTRRIDYFEEGELLKRLTTSDLREIEGHWYAMKMVMANLQEGGQTAMETLQIRFDVELSDDLFTTANLKRR